MFERVNSAAKAARDFIAAKPRLCFRGRSLCVVFKSRWLRGTYMARIKRGDDLNTAISDVVLANMPFEPTLSDIRAIRYNPSATIVEIF